VQNRLLRADRRAVSDWDDSSSGASAGLKLTVAAVLAVAIGALAFTWYTYQHQHSLVQAERDAREAQIATLQHELSALRGKDSTTAARIQALQTKEGDLAPLAKRVLKSVFTVFSGNELGSGFVAWNDDSSSYLITARHVVKNNLNGFVTLQRASGGTWQGEIQAEDAKNDLAVIRIDGHPAGAAPLWQQPLRQPPSPGDALLLVGSPYGLSGTVTTGIVSRVTSKLIQTDAAANPGNSGGPALDGQGHVIGVLVSGILGSGLSFAVPIARVCEQLRSC
jgi:S1-C subfamily serine protease